jgi:protein tyrosine/serine phosphatase
MLIKLARILPLFLLTAACAAQTAATQPSAAPRSDQPSASASTSGPKAVELVPSEDPQFHDFHSLGLIDGRVDIFRCASPVHDLPDASEAKARFQHFYDLGIRTDISLEDPNRADFSNGKPADQTTANETKERFELEKQAAAETGIAFVNYPMNNSGPDSFQTMTDVQVKDWLDTVSQDVLERAKTGGVVFHCSAGHDRTGMVAAYIRMKYEHWSVDQAIAEMRRYGHNWRKFSNNGGVSSWQEDHLRAIAKMLEPESTSAN